MDSYKKDKVFLIDGYPRNSENFEGFKEVFGNDFTIVTTLYLSCDESTCVNRLLNRGQTSGRSDDEAEVIKKRFNTFYSESVPVLEELKLAGHFIEIDSTKSLEEVDKNVTSQLEQLIN